MSISSEPVTLLDTSPEGQAPCVPERLVRGCLLTKITKSKKQEKLFFLDVEGSRVSWRGAVTMKVFHIDNIKSIRSGEEAASYQQALRGEAVDSELCFTVNYAASDSSKQVKTLHLVAHCPADLKLWLDTLESLAKHREELMTVRSSERESVMRAHWETEIARRPESSKVHGLDLPAIQSLCRKLHIHALEKELEEHFNSSDLDKSKRLTYEQFKDFLKRLRERSDIKKIFNGLKEAWSPGITRYQFVSFLEEVQGINLADLSEPALWEEKINDVVATSFPNNPEL
ncbi:hypothetical protein LTR40_012508, partial [Exophiala xenobiotica]